MTCIPCIEAEERRKKIYAADTAGREFMRMNGIDSVIVVDVLFDIDEHKRGDVTFCLPNDERLYSAFFEISTIIN